jgi:hypothetical protein
MEGSGRGLIEVLPWNFLGGTEENQFRPSVTATLARSVRLLVSCGVSCALTYPFRDAVAAYDRVALQGASVANHCGVHPVGNTPLG